MNVNELVSYECPDEGTYFKNFRNPSARLLPWFQRFIFIIFIAKGKGKINLWSKAAIDSDRAAPISLN